MRVVCAGLSATLTTSPHQASLYVTRAHGGTFPCVTSAVHDMPSPRTRGQRGKQAQVCGEAAALEHECG